MNEDELRRVLDAEAMSVEVSPDALANIRRRISQRRARWLPRGGAMFAMSTGGLAALATVVAVFAGVGSCVPAPTDPPPPGATSPPVVVPTTDAPTPGPTATPAGITANVAVYYQGQDRGRPRLYREFHDRPAADASKAAKVSAALTDMFTGRPLDPDYSDAWPDTARVRSVAVEGNAVVVDLTGVDRNSVGTEVAHMAVEQLIWTATANADVDIVRLRVDGQPVDELWGAVRVAGDLRRGPSLEVAASVWLISPQEGQTVPRTFTVQVSGVVFEATMQIRVVQNGREVTSTFLTLDNGPPTRGNGTLRLTLAPGTYTLEAYEISAADGSVQHLDDHTITVR